MAYIDLVKFGTDPERAVHGEDAEVELLRRSLDAQEGGAHDVIDLSELIVPSVRPAIVAGAGQLAVLSASQSG